MILLPNANVLAPDDWKLISRNKLPSNHKIMMVCLSAKLPYGLNHDKLLISEGIIISKPFSLWRFTVGEAAINVYPSHK